MFFKIQVFDLMAERVFKLTLTDDQESGIGDLAHDQVGGVNEISLALVGIEGGDISDEWSTMG